MSVIVVFLRPLGLRLDSPITHGICKACREYYFGAKRPTSLRTFLNRLDTAVVMVDDDMKIMGVNDQAEAVFGRPLPTESQKYGGHAFNCMHASEPGGCGKTPFCRSCTLRTTVNYSFLTNRARDHIPAYIDVISPDGPKRTRLRISTERVGEIVLMRVDETSPYIYKT